MANRGGRQEAIGLDPIRVVVVDKSPFVQEGIRSLFDSDERFAPVESVDSVTAFVELLGGERFDVAVVGWVFTDGSGHEILEWLATLEHSPRVIVYTGDPQPGIPRTAMSLGAAGFCAKSEPPERLMETVVNVGRGLMVFPFVDMTATADRDPIQALTPRESALVAALVEGHSNKSLATEFGLSVNTVKFHLGNAYAKLGVRNRARAVAVFLQSSNSY